MTGLGRIAACATIAVMAALAGTQVGASAAPDDRGVRQCVERNSVRYANPGSAVVDQYADLETRCRAVLEDSEVVVQIDSDPPTRTSSRTAAAPGSSSTGGDTGAPAASTGDDVEPAAPTREDVTETPAPQSASAALVRSAIGSAGADAGAPAPTAVADMPGWLIILLLCIGLAGAGATAVGVRRRSR